MRLLEFGLPGRKGQPTAWSLARCSNSSSSAAGLVLGLGMTLGRELHWDSPVTGERAVKGLATPHSAQAQPPPAFQAQVHLVSLWLGLLPQGLLAASPGQARCHQRHTALCASQQPSSPADLWGPMGRGLCLATTSYPLPHPSSPRPPRAAPVMDRGLGRS